MPYQKFLFLFCFFGLAVAAASQPALGQGLIPADASELQSLNEFEPNILEYEQFTSKIENADIVYGAENKQKNEAPKTSPEKISLEEFLPPVGNQKGKDCVAWAVGYGLYSTIVAKERGKTPTQNWELFSPRFIYRQIGKDKTKGIRLYSKTKPNALSFVEKHGCATVETCPYGNGPDEWFKSKLTKKSKLEAQNFKALKIRRVPNLKLLKRTLAGQIPVVLGIQTNDEFKSNKDNGVYTFDIKAPNSTPNDKHHALIAVGYDDEKKAIRVMNSWGTDWKEDGFCWVSYSSLETINQQNWCIEAYAVWLRNTKYPKLFNDDKYLLELDASNHVFWRKEEQRIKTTSGMVEGVCASLDEIYMIQKGKVYVWAEMLDDNDEIDRLEWFDISEGEFPNGLKHKGFDQPVKATMITSIPTGMYILGVNGIVYGRYEAEVITNSRWEILVLPDQMRCVDIRSREDLKLYATSSEGTIYVRKPGKGWISE